jgi:DNA-binding LytR/AlgR family response regulator
MTCIIIDDEPLAREGLELKLKQIEFLQLKGMFSGGIAANNYLSTNAVDLIFIDIHMPDMTGIELIQSLINPPLIIFTTAFAEYALEGYALDAVDYLLKPLDLKRVVKAANKAHEIWQAKQISHLIDNRNKPSFLFIRANRQYNKVLLKDIKYIEGKKNYAMVYTSTEKYMTAISLLQILDQLPIGQFTRIHKSFIINVSLVKQILPESIVLENGITVPFGKTFQDEFIEKFVKGNLLERKII